MQLHEIGMHSKLTASSQTQLERSYHHRNRRVADAHRCILEHTYGHVELIVILLHSHHEDHTYIRSSRKILSIIGNDQPSVILFRNIYSLVQSLNHISTYSVHLGVKLAVDDSIPQVYN